MVGSPTLPFPIKVEIERRYSVYLTKWPLSIRLPFGKWNLVGIGGVCINMLDRLSGKPKRSNEPHDLFQPFGFLVVVSKPHSGCVPMAHMESRGSFLLEGTLGRFSRKPNRKKTHVTPFPIPNLKTKHAKTTRPSLGLDGLRTFEHCISRVAQTSLHHILLDPRDLIRGHDPGLVRLVGVLWRKGKTTSPQFPT